MGEAAAESNAPSIVAYGFDGFWTGAQIGLATGYLATGSDFESREWRKLVFGAGVGALAGVGVGLTLGVLDVGQPPPRSGRIILRDLGYGVGLGAVVGTATGALFLIDSGEPKDLLTGAAIGTLIGGAAGVVFGIIEASAEDSDTRTEVEIERSSPSVGFTLVASQDSLIPLPGLAGTF